MILIFWHPHIEIDNEIDAYENEGYGEDLTPPSHQPPNGTYLHQPPWLLAAEMIIVSPNGTLFISHLEPIYYT